MQIVSLCWLRLLVHRQEEGNLKNKSRLQLSFFHPAGIRTTGRISTGTRAFWYRIRKSSADTARYVTAACSAVSAAWFISNSIPPMCIRWESDTCGLFSRRESAEAAWGNPAVQKNATLLRPVFFCLPFVNDAPAKCCYNPVFNSLKIIEEPETLYSQRFWLFCPARIFWLTTAIIKKYKVCFAISLIYCCPVQIHVVPSCSGLLVCSTFYRNQSETLCSDHPVYWILCMPPDSTDRHS